MAQGLDALSGFNHSHNLNQLKPAAINPLLSKLFGGGIEEIQAEQEAAKDYLLKTKPALIEPWIGVDLDGTLAEYNGYKGPDIIGEPIPKMVQRVKDMLAAGKNVKVFTARVYADDSDKRRREKVAATVAIWAWCERHIGARLEVTCVKDFGMVELWDDRAVQVIINTGERADGK